MRMTPAVRRTFLQFHDASIDGRCRRCRKHIRFILIAATAFYDGWIAPLIREGRFDLHIDSIYRTRKEDAGFQAHLAKRH